MFSKKINTKNFFFRKKDFFDTLSSIFLAICSCCNCIISSKIYCINNNFKKYIKYIQSSCNYNLTIFFILIKQIYLRANALKERSAQCVYKIKLTRKTTKFFKK